MEMLSRKLMLLIAVALWISPVRAADVTFYKDVLPVLQSHCQECHRPGEIGPMPLLTYQQARPWAKSIKTAVLTGKMPPWPADPHFGKFSNDRALSKAQIDTLVAWADSNALEGKAAEAPKPRTWVEGWNIGAPDRVIEMPQSFDMPAKGTVEYQYIIVPSGLTEDKWVQAVEVRPSNRGVVHHAVVYLREPGSRWLGDAKPGVAFAPTVASDRERFVNTQGGGSDVLTVYTPGTEPDMWKPGQAKLIKAGSDFVFQMHYTANGKAGPDQTRVGLVYAKEPTKERVLTIGALNNRFKIPAGDPNFSAEATTPIMNPMTILSLSPHMHLRGKGFQFDVIYPDGKTDTILKLNSWDLNWQLAYKLAEPLALQPGTRVKATGWWDNSANNPANPDPKVDVVWGEQSWEEMLVGFMTVATDPKFDMRSLMRGQPR
jgi:hypothetical protein